MSNSKYDVLSQSVEVLLSPGTAQFQVPVFQRRYAWGSEEITQLIDDLFGESSEVDSPYFLGSIVLARQESAPDLILDGQQRLTTLSLIISALIHKLRIEESSDADEHKMYLFSRRIKGKKTPKVILQDDDAKIYEALINNPQSCYTSIYKHTRLGEALIKIFFLLNEYAISPQFIRYQKPFETMLARLLYDVELVRITAPSERDAFRLFETLNDRGLALSAADLIKNKLFSRCKDDLSDAIEAWSNLLMLTKDDDLVNFLRTYWIAFKGFARKRGLYDTFKNHIDTLNATSATQFIVELEEVGKLYDQIVAPNLTKCPWGPDVAAALERLTSSYRVRSCRPVLLSFARFRHEEMELAVQLCEAITIRYSIVGEKNPNHLERMYSEMCEIIRRSENPWKEFQRSSIFDEVPNDAEFQAKMSTMEITNITLGWREVLIHLNNSMGDSEIIINRPNRVHVEHILPQRPRYADLTDAGLAQLESMSLTNYLGNLTLLSSRKNQQLSNRPFTEKRSVYARSDIYLTRELASFERWSRSEIVNRSKQLAQIAVKLFPHPKQIGRNMAG